MPTEEADLLVREAMSQRANDTPSKPKQPASGNDPDASRDGVEEFDEHEMGSRPLLG